KDGFPVGSVGSKHPPPAATPVGILNAPAPPLDNPVAPPGNSQTAKTSAPAPTVPKGFSEARPPAVSTFPLESIPALPDCSVTGCPVWARYTAFTSYPLSKALSNRLSDVVRGTSYNAERAKW